MLSLLIRRRWWIIGGLALVAVLGGVWAAAGGVGSGGKPDPAATGASTERPSAGQSPEDIGGETVVIYNGRSHYGTEQVFLDFEDQTGVDVELRGGSASELFQRLNSEGEDTPADLFVTTDLARLWRAQQANLLEGVTTPTLRENIPEELHAANGEWWAITTRRRIPVVSTERVEEGAVQTYADLGDPRFEGRLCLRTSQSEYNQSLVADFLVKRGREDTRQLLQSWMDNNPEIMGSDGEMLGAMAGGECDVGLANDYYLGRALDESDGEFPVAPAWPDQDGAGAHQNVSGVGLVRWSDADAAAIALMEYLTGVEAQAQIASRSEAAANPEAPYPEHISSWQDVNNDPIAVREAGQRLDEATQLMLEVGWE